MAKSFRCALTSFFRVKNAPAFRAWAEERGLLVVGHPEKPTLVALAPAKGRKRFQKETYHGDSGRDLADDVARFLAKGEVALILELGTKDRATLGGYVIVATAGTKRCDVLLDPVAWTCQEAGGMVCWRICDRRAMSREGNFS